MNHPYGKTTAGIHLEDIIDENDKRIAGSIFTDANTIFKQIQKSKNIINKRYLYQIVYRDILNRLDIAKFKSSKTRTYMKNVLKPVFVNYLRGK